VTCNDVSAEAGTVYIPGLVAVVDGEIFPYDDMRDSQTIVAWVKVS
jgi:hypothetical protein